MSHMHHQCSWLNICGTPLAAGSLFISYTIKTFGALIFATIMTTRQLLSILLSCFLFMHPLSLGQWWVWAALGAEWMVEEGDACLDQWSGCTSVDVWVAGGAADQLDIACR